MTKKVYKLLKKKDTEEYHLFECTPRANDKCSCNKTSICGKVESSESVKTVFACQTEDYSRTEIARIGRTVCGTCVSHLYETY
jgi:hypothetical protein